MMQMIQRTEPLSGEARHNIEYCLENDIKNAEAYLKNSFLRQSSNSVVDFFQM